MAASTSSDEGPSCIPGITSAPTSAQPVADFPITFSHSALLRATKDFNRENLIREDDLGSVFQGKLVRPRSSTLNVVVKQLKSKIQYVEEVSVLSIVRHPHIVNFIGYCGQRGCRVLVYEHMPFLDVKLREDHLDWNARMKIATGVAKAMNYLHCEVNPSVIYGGLKSSGVLLGEGFHPKLFEFGLAQFNRKGRRRRLSANVVGACAYCAPEYASTGQPSLESDVYSFGVLLLELLTGDENLPQEKKLHDWVHELKSYVLHFEQILDPKLRCRFPDQKTLREVVHLALMCVRKNPQKRPTMKQVQDSVESLSSKLYVDPNDRTT